MIERKRQHLLSALLVVLISASTGWAQVPEDRKSAPEYVRKAHKAQEQLADTVEQFIPSFVFISGGSGVLISEEGHFLTNYHVIARKFQVEREQDQQPDRVITVETVGGTSHKALIVGIDPYGDLALCKIVEESEHFQPLPIGNSDEVSVGQSVFALGNPFLRGQFTARPIITAGLISATHVFKRSYPDAIQTDAPINPGNSGGPLVTLDGKLIGINGRIETKFGNRANSGVGYALSSARIQRFLPMLKKGGIAFHAKSSLLNRSKIEMEDGTLRLKSLDKEGLPYQSGLRSGDEIRSVAGYPVTSFRRFAGIVQSFPGPNSVRIAYRRNGERRTTQLQLEQQGSWDQEQILDTLPVSRDAPYLGVGLSEEELPIQITRVVDQSPAAEAGIKEGDRLLKINDRDVPTKAAAIRMIQSRWYGEPISITVQRNGDQKTLEAVLGRRGE